MCMYSYASITHPYAFISFHSETTKNVDAQYTYIFVDKSQIRQHRKVVIAIKSVNSVRIQSNMQTFAKTYVNKVLV